MAGGRRLLEVSDPTRPNRGRLCARAGAAAQLNQTARPLLTHVSTAQRLLFSGEKLSMRRKPVKAGGGRLIKGLAMGALRLATGGKWQPRARHPPRATLSRKFASHAVTYDRSTTPPCRPVRDWPGQGAPGLEWQAQRARRTQPSYRLVSGETAVVGPWAPFVDPHPSQMRWLSNGTRRTTPPPL